MQPNEHEQVIQELETLISDTQTTIDRIEAYGLDYEMPEDYQALLDILDNAIKHQREHTLAMLATRL